MKVPYSSLMKPCLSTFIKLTFAILVLGVLSTCDIIRSNKQCEVAPPTGTTQLIIDLNGDSAAVMAEYWRADMYNPSFDILGTPNDGVSFMPVYNFTKRVINASLDRVYALIVYNHMSISDTSWLKQDHIDGLSVYGISGNTLHHQLFIKDSTESFVEVQKLSIPVSGVTSNHLNHYITNVVYDVADERPKSYIQTFSPDAVEMEANKAFRRNVPFILSL